MNSVAFRCSRCGFARIPLHFDAPAVVSRDFRPLLGPLRSPTATARAVRRGLGFDAPAVVSREFRCVSMLPLRFRANSGLAWPLQASSGGAAEVADRNGARGGAGPWFRRSRCGFARLLLRFDAPAVVSRGIRCISMLPLSVKRWEHLKNEAFSWLCDCSQGLAGALGFRVC